LLLAQTGAGESDRDVTNRERKYGSHLPRDYLPRFTLALESFAVVPAQRLACQANCDAFQHVLSFALG
jgi:hypothetical protein